MQGPPADEFTPGWYTIVAEVDRFDGTSICTDSTVIRARLRYGP
jgi:hypothetical protein